MTTAYCLSYEYLDYSHREEIDISPDKAAILEQYNHAVSDCKDNDVYGGIDYISVEVVDVEVNEDGAVESIIEYGDVIAETVLNEPGD